jgi:hypothetical protein
MELEFHETRFVGLRLDGKFLAFHKKKTPPYTQCLQFLQDS